MDCALCKQPIENYPPWLNRLDLDETNSVDICSVCIDKFFKWQRSISTDLFPTKAAKKRKKKMRDLRRDRPQNQL